MPAGTIRWWVSGNGRLTFRVDGDDAEIVSHQDYH